MRSAAPPDHHTRELGVDIARQLDVAVGQALDSMLADLDTFKASQFGRRDVIRKVERFQVSTREVLDSLREMVLGISPPATVDLPGTLARDFGPEFEAQWGLAVSLTAEGAWPPVPAAVGTSLAQIVAEAIRNARWHGGASAVRIDLELGESAARITVTDNGRGMLEGATDRPGMGLQGMRERAMLLGGRLTVSSGVEQGTTVCAVIPKESLS